MGLRTFLLVGLLLLCACSAPPADGPEGMVVYVGQNPAVAEPILKSFPGARLAPRWDTEPGRSTGLASLLAAEGDATRCEAFWTIDFISMVTLQGQGLLLEGASPPRPAAFADPKGRWCILSTRARVILYNRDQVKEPPRSMLELADPRWKGKVAWARPLFGPSRLHVMGMFQALGPEKARAWVEAMAANAILVDSNSQVREMVARGQAPLGIADSDDATSAGAVGGVFPDADGIGTFLVPNAVAVPKGAPHPEEGKRLVAFLASPDVERTLVQAGHLPVTPGVQPTEELRSLGTLKPMEIDYSTLGEGLSEINSFVEDTFLR